ncbi:MAG: hypothetical protein H6541_01660 [Lentimicrobiaceae bacterium]|nr:hypothetical protein [Lentimicrobiaceae bacterium]MCB9023116.1 hypothetical protein [Lentimicrobiaceae bacterium]MCO5264641.1 hypothetical protein [Lentimicrobium sp.]HPG32995.1 hypothetical protein [Lentimicrobium sp.]
MLRKGKKLYLLILPFLCTLSVSAQQREICITGGFSENSLVYFAHLAGGASYDNEGSWHSGLQFNEKLTSKLWFSTGLIYSKHSIKVTPEFFPGIEIQSRTEEIQLMSIPMEVKVDFLKFLFLKGGPIIDLELNSLNSGTDAQSGLGIELGIGAKIKMHRLIFEVNPFAKVHSMPAFSPERYHQHLIESGMNFCVGFSF